jgi:2-oxoglutarate dehydrogenase E2 component (dihydrolipoamide succinyltransferase)
MAKVQIEVPSVGESVTQGVLTAWLVKEGEQVHEGADLYELETDKATMAVPSPATGVLHITVAQGSEIAIGQVVGEIEAAGAAASGIATAGPAQSRAPQTALPTPPLSPAVRRLVEENRLDPSAMSGSGKGGRLTKGDVLAAMESSAAAPSAPPAPPAPRLRSVGPADRRERMSTLRKTMARRLVEAKTLTAHLTTFGEVNMSRIVELRGAYQEAFRGRHGVRLGYMSFFIKASCRALAEFPVLNAMVDGEEIVFHEAHDVGVAVSTDRGLVVPVIRDADGRSFAELEKALADLAERARAKKILPDELAGGTFTITNGGVFGSLLSTPIINYPQSAILGMHAIQKRPVVVDDQIVVRPMMYLALSYDHRLIDGREAVMFLGRIKALCEEPERMLFEV